MSAQPEQWRVSTVEGIFETDLETLKQWIVEGCVLPTDKVSKGNLNWIDAGRVPKLKGAFNGEVEMTPPPNPTVTSTQSGWQTPPTFEDSQHSNTDRTHRPPQQPMSPQPQCQRLLVTTTRACHPTIFVASAKPYCVMNVRNSLATARSPFVLCAETCATHIRRSGIKQRGPNSKVQVLV